jgi:hypothetical protein
MGRGLGASAVVWVTALAGEAVGLPPGVRVVQAGAVPGGNGREWATAYADLQAALDEAAAPGSGVTEIWVAAGTYRPSRRTTAGDPKSATFTLMNGLGIYGGFSGIETTREQRNPDPTANGAVLSGAISGVPNVYHVVSGAGLDETAVLDGVTVRDGDASHSAAPGDPDARGGGMSIQGGQLTLANLLITMNHAAYAGGGVYAAGESTCRSVRIVQNSVGAHGVGGGGVVNGTFYDCLVQGNSASETTSAGGGLAGGGTFHNCTISSNSVGSYGQGGGISGGGMFYGCSIGGNTAGADGNGGGISGGGTFWNCDISGNSAERGGVLAGSGTFVECTITSNGALYGAVVRGEAVFQSCTIARNNASEFYGVAWGACRFVSSVLSENYAIIDYGIADTGIFENCLIERTNTDVNAGGGIIGACTMRNCTLAGNRGHHPALIPAGSAVANCIVWGNGGGIAAPSSVNYSIVEGWNGSLGGVGNNGMDPMFVDFPGRNYHLLPGSPAIDSGDDFAAPAGLLADVEGRARFWDSPEPDAGNGPAPVVDRGCYEANAPVFCYGNCDGSTTAPVLNVADFVCFMSRFASGHPAANCDGSTNSPVLNVNDFVCFQRRFVEGCE